MGTGISKCYLLSHVKPRTEKSQGEENFYVFHSHILHSFCYNVLKAATNKFSIKNLAGQGGCGDVYKGWIDSRTKDSAKPGHGLPIAIKRIKKHGAQGLDEWKNELMILSKIHHPNVVKMLGYCAEGVHRMLVFEFIPFGSLEENLSRGRMKIATGLARGLEYLHTMATPIIHRDIKSANVLLDHDFTPKIADFGLSRYGPQGDRTHLSTRVLGSQGYFAPEYIGTGHLTLKTDVYSLGVVLLEILSGLRAVKRYPNGKLTELSCWAMPYLNNKKQLHYVIDKRIVKKVEMAEAYDFAIIILQCLNKDPKIGLRAVKRYPNGKLTELSCWAMPYLNNKKQLHYVIDKRIVKKVEMAEAYDFAIIILQCLNKDPKIRPTITEVLHSLQHLEKNIDK